MSIRDGFNRARPALEQLALSAGAAGARARAQLALLPAAIDFLERETFNGTAQEDRFDAVGQALANILGQTLVTTIPSAQRLQSLSDVLNAIGGQVSAQLRAQRDARSLILPERFQ